MVPPMDPLPLLVDLSAYQAAAFERGWFRRAGAAQTVPPGLATLALACHYAPGHYPLMAQASFATAKADFEKVRAAKAGPAPLSNKPTFDVLSTSGAAEVMAGSVGASGVGLVT